MRTLVLFVLIKSIIISVVLADATDICQPGSFDGFDFSEGYTCSEVTEISHNLTKTIKELTIMNSKKSLSLSNGSFPYSQLQNLYLQNNTMDVIQENTFNSLKMLKKLYMIKNIGPKEIPLVSIFNHPSLTNLKINNNNNYSLTNDKFEFGITSSSIEMLDLSYNNLTKIPSLMPLLLNLTTLDLSSNKIDKITAENLASMCNLEKLNLENNDLSFADADCHCKRIHQWAKQYQKKLTNDLDHYVTCEENKKCPREFNDFENALLIYNNCINGKIENITRQLSLAENLTYDDPETTTTSSSEPPPIVATSTASNSISDPTTISPTDASDKETFEHKSNKGNSDLATWMAVGFAILIAKLLS